VRPRLKTVTVHRPDAEPVTKRVGEWLTSGGAGFEVDGFQLPVVALVGRAGDCPQQGTSSGRSCRRM
jgi:hypothetical protein